MAVPKQVVSEEKQCYQDPHPELSDGRLCDWRLKQKERTNQEEWDRVKEKELARKKTLP